MQVHQILKQKADDQVVTIAPDASVADAAALLSERRIGAVVVSRGGKRPDGILSERDIVREIGRRGPECLNARVEEMMTSALTCCERNDSTNDILSKMTEGRFRHMPVVEGEEMIGLISIGDVVKARLSELRMERDALQDLVMGH